MGEIDLTPVMKVLSGKGWPSVKQVLPSVLNQAHYRTDAEALLVVVDSNSSGPHVTDHEQPGTLRTNCRLYEIRAVVDGELPRLRSVPGKSDLKVALGLAVPSIEAWYLSDSSVSEAAWMQGLASGAPPYTTNELKQRVYGTDRPSQALLRHFTEKEASRLASSVSVLEGLFPNGFGHLARIVRPWRA